MMQLLSLFFGLKEIYLHDFHYYIVIFKKNTANVIKIEKKTNKGKK